MTSVHIFAPNKRTRSRRMCPYHKHFCYCSIAEYYDGVYTTFDCGTHTDSEYWYPPPKQRCAHLKDSHK